jgi:predicted metal-dependent phosphoesterase TrpH
VGKVTFLLRFDLHIHSKYSFDSFSDPNDIIEKAKMKGINVISITDHNSMKVHSIIPKNTDVTVIPGMEISTTKGDIIGIFLKEPINKRDFLEVVDEIRKQDGIIVLPHPYRRKCDPQDLIEHIDLIEIKNGRLRSNRNMEAYRLYKKTESALKPISGSDAHACFEIGSVITEIDGIAEDMDEIRKMLLKNDRRIQGNGSPYLLAHTYSFTASIIKRLQRMF